MIEQDERATWPWVEDRQGWRAFDAPNAERRCRYTVGPGHATCKRPSVALLRRVGWSGFVREWAYCESHLYGRRWESGRILARVHPDSTAAKQGYLPVEETYRNGRT